MSEVSEKSWEAALSDSVISVPRENQVRTNAYKMITSDKRNSLWIIAYNLVCTLEVFLSDFWPGSLKFSEQS